MYIYIYIYMYVELTLSRLAGVPDYRRASTHERVFTTYELGRRTRAEDVQVHGVHFTWHDAVCLQCPGKLIAVSRIPDRG